MSTSNVKPLALVPAVAQPSRASGRFLFRPARSPARTTVKLAGLALAFLLALVTAMPGHALDLVTFAGVTGPLVSALTQISALAPGVKALVGFIGFVVAFISLTALRNFGPVLFYLGMAIFGAVGLTIAGAILGLVL